MDPLKLNELYVADGLIYGVQVDTMAQSATLTIQIDTNFNRGVCEKAGVEASGVVLLDFLFSGVTSAAIEGMLPRRTRTAHDEPPHSYEIASWKVNQQRLQNAYRLRVHTHWGPRCSISFNGVSVSKSSRSPGVVHDYKAEAAGKTARE